MTWVPSDPSLSVMLLIVDPKTGAAARRRSAVSDATARHRRSERRTLVSSRILVTLFRLQFDRHRLGFSEGVLDDLELRLGDSRDIAVDHRIADAQHEAAVAAVLDEGELVRRSPHDPHQVDVPHVDQRSVARALELAVEEREEGIAPARARIDVLVAREEHAGLERLRPFG